MNSPHFDDLEFEIDPLSDGTITKLKDGAYNQLPAPIIDASTEVKEDIEFSRTRIRKAMDIGGAVLETAQELSKMSEDPKIFAVVSRLIDSISNASDKLVRLEQQKAITKSEKESDIHNHLYVGSPTDLQKMLNDKK